MTPTYPLEAQIHSLSLLANAAFDLQEPSFQTLETLTTTIITNSLADTTIQGYIGDWQLVWGPVVFSNNPNAPSVVADNTMMLVYSLSQNQFVIAIAGTNSVSMYGWFQEDFGVNTLVDWGTIVNKSVDKIFYKPSIAAGTNNGLQILLNMVVTTTSGTTTMLQQLNNYVQTQAITGASVAVAGHSLGGALAPVVAMYMQDTQTTWNTVSNSISTITTYPTAGPTPGNSDFANYVQTNMGANYISRYNTIDVVPQAWMFTSFENIPSIYPEITAPEAKAPFYTSIGLLISIANLRTVDKSDLYLRINYQQISPWNALTGTFDTGTDSKAKLEATTLDAYAGGNLSQYTPYFKVFYRFLMQMLYQHTTAYDVLLGITDLATEFKVVKDNATSSTEEQRRVQSVGLAFEKYYGIPGLNIAAVNAPAEAAAIA